MRGTTSAELALDALEDPVFVRDPSGRLEYVNAAAAVLLGEPRDEIVGRPFDALLPERVRAIDGLPFIDWVLRSERVGARPVRMPVRRSDGVEIHQSMRLTTSTNADGVSMVIVLRPPDDTFDIECDPLHLGAESPAAESSQRAVFESVPVGVLHFDARARITACNDMFVAQMGSTRERLIGLDMLTLPNDGVREAVKEALAGREGHFDGEYVSATGGLQRTLRALFSPVRSDRRVSGGVGVVEDVTERREMDLRLAQGERMASLGRLAAGVAHEINNPLAYVRTSLEVARRELERFQANEDPEHIARAIAVLGHADEGVERVSVIANDLKTFSRGDDGSWVPVALPRVAESAINLAWNEIRHRAQLVKELEPVPRVMGSESRFVQVLVNLLVNAAQAIPEGDAANNRIALRTGTTDEGRAYVEVEDTGIGIPPDRVAHIFEPFWTSKPKGVGTGLGLSICHGIVTAAGGDIRVVSSVPGDGTLVRIELPAAPAEAGADARPAPPSGGSSPAPGAPRPRILVIDDEVQLAATLRAGLEASFEVRVATSGKDALAMLEEEDPDFVLCDLMMPEISGMELYERVLASRPALADRFVFMTGGAFTDRAREFLKRHRCPRIEKPFSLEEVERLLGAGG